MTTIIPAVGCFECPRFAGTDKQVERAALQTFQEKWAEDGKWAHNAHQYKGCVVDGRIVDAIGSHSGEVKNDSYCARSGRLFYETEQTNDNKKTWRPSGLRLCAQEGTKLFIMVGHTPTTAYMLHAAPDVLLPIVRKYDVLETRPGANGNPPGLYGRGHVVPLDKMMAELLALA